jgi:hypothetical protein
VHPTMTTKHTVARDKRKQLLEKFYWLLSSSPSNLAMDSLVH